MSQTNRQTKEPVRADSSAGNERNFRIVIRFFDEYEAEHPPGCSREEGGPVPYSGLFDQNVES